MKKMTVSFEIDLDDAEQVERFKDILDGITAEASPGTVKATMTKEPTQTTPKKEEKKQEITIDQLRELTKEKSGDVALRPRIKAKLKELGASTVTDLPADKYADYKKFITDLK